MLIISTVGPSILEKGVIKEVIQSGSNVLRFNFSHGEREKFEELLKNAREIKKDIHIMQDLSGSKIRVSSKLPFIYKIYNGEEVIFCGEDKYENGKLKKGDKGLRVIPLNIESKKLSTNDINEISMKDNTMRFEVVKEELGILTTKVTSGGIVRAGKGCNIKGFDRKNIELSLKDKNDISWAIEKNIDIICQSFVEDENQITEIIDFIASMGKVRRIPKIWAKVETPRGIENIHKISSLVDGILIGRGDLIAESSIVKAPKYQYEALDNMKAYKKDIIIGTHLLNSMKNGRSPELSEVESIYNLINYGVTGFMLAGETSIGKAPIKTVSFLNKLINEYEKKENEE
ncbi:MAG: pyruvate kinase [Clostridium sp.]